MKEKPLIDISKAIIKASQQEEADKES